MKTTKARDTSRTHDEQRGGRAKPNFVFILADDLGYADLHCYGGRAHCSPNIDRMASEGLRFTNGYANSSVCSPSRFAIATGRYQHRLRGGFDEPIATVTPALGLPPEHPTMASLLRDAGYATALVGPGQGFDQLFSNSEGDSQYYSVLLNAILTF